MGYYKVLGLNTDATEAEVKAAYRDLVHKWHPDTNKSPEAAKIFRQVQAAYDAIMSGKTSRQQETSQQTHAEQPQQEEPRYTYRDSGKPENRQGNAGNRQGRQRPNRNADSHEAVGPQIARTLRTTSTEPSGRHISTSMATSRIVTATTRSSLCGKTGMLQIGPLRSFLLCALQSM